MHFFGHFSLHSIFGHLQFSESSPRCCAESNAINVDANVRIQARKTQSDKVRLKRGLPAMVHNYFLNKYCANAGTRTAALWPWWKFSDQHRRFPLVVQLLRFALGASSYNKHKDLLACEPQPW